MRMARDIGSLIKSAREYRDKGFILEAENIYLDAIKELEKRLDSSNKSKAELWTTKAEYLLFKEHFFLKNEGCWDPITRVIEAIKLLKSTIELGNEYADIKSKIKKIIKNTITKVGCIIPETEKHVCIKCPIKLRNMGAGKYGFSIGLFIKKAECSICGRDYVKDIKCEHESGKIYDGKICLVIAKDCIIDHVSLVKNPKDIGTEIKELMIPKEEFYSSFDDEVVKRKTENSLPIICTFCKENNIDPKEIDIVTYIQMQENSS